MLTISISLVSTASNKQLSEKAFSFNKYSMKNLFLARITSSKVITKGGNNLSRKREYETVYLAKNIKDNKNYAAKVCNIDESFDGKEQMLFLRESIILLKLCHPLIVKFYGINFKSLTDPAILEPTIITQYLSNGSLRKILTKKKNHFQRSNGHPPIYIYSF